MASQTLSAEPIGNIRQDDENVYRRVPTPGVDSGQGLAGWPSLNQPFFQHWNFLYRTSLISWNLSYTAPRRTEEIH